MTLSSRSAQAEERKDSEDDHNQSDEIDQAVHVSLRELPSVQPAHRTVSQQERSECSWIYGAQRVRRVKADRERLPRPWVQRLGASLTRASLSPRKGLASNACKDAGRGGQADKQATVRSQRERGSDSSAVDTELVR